MLNSSFKSYLVVICLIFLTELNGQAQDKHCYFEVSRIATTNTHTTVTVRAYDSVKKPMVVLYYCGSKITIGLPDYFTGAAVFTDTIPKIDCKCNEIEVAISTASPPCDTRFKYTSNHCALPPPTPPPPPPPPRTPENLVVHDTIYKEVIVERKVAAMPICKTCVKWWECFEECYLNWLLGIIVGIYFMIRIRLIGNAATLKIPLFGTLVWSNFWEFLLGSAAMAVLAYCPCQSAVWGLIGLTITLLTIFFDLFRKDKKYPEWRSALLISIGFIGSMISIMLINCGWQ